MRNNHNSHDPLIHLAEQLCGRDGSLYQTPVSGPNQAFDKNGAGGAFGERALPLSTGLPKRKLLSHQLPSWVRHGAIFFISINCEPRGINQLAIPAVAENLKQSIAKRIQLRQWWPKLVLLMSDHLHGLMTFNPNRPFQEFLHDWKRFTARNFHIAWQRDFFDHRIRSKESLREKWNYIIHNPVRAGLVASHEEWPFVWTSETWERDENACPSTHPKGESETNYK